MKKFNETLQGLHTRVDKFLTNESSTQQIEEVGDIKKALIEIGEIYENLQKELTGTKDKLVEFVKSSSFAPNDQVETDIGGEEKSLDQIMIEQAKITLERKKN